MPPLVLTLTLLLFAAATPIRVVILDGESAGPYHDWKAVTPVLKKELDETGLFQVDVATMPTTVDFSRYQVVVSNLDSPDWPPELKTAFERYMNGGGGFVSVHAADNSFPGWPAYNRMTGIGGWRGRDQRAGLLWFYTDGQLVSDTGIPGPAGGHGARLPFQVVTRNAEHPIMRGLPPIWMHRGDELYNSLRGPGGDMDVLATAYSDPANSGTGRDELMLFTLTYGKGRIFHTVLGHDVSALSCIGFITTFQRGTEWAATGRVTQPVPVNFPTADSVSFRADLVAVQPNPAPK